MGVAYNPRIVTDGLVACYDLGNTRRSYSPNIHPSPTNIYDWYVGIRGNAGANNSTIAKDTIESPVGNTPLRMDITGNDPYIVSYSGLEWNLGEASRDETWTVSVYAKASTNISCQIFIFGTPAGGGYVEAPAGTIPLTTEWQRVSFTHTFTNANTVYIQSRLDGPDTGGAGESIWFDGWQVERGSTSSNFTSDYTSGNVLDISRNSNNGTIVSSPQYNNSNGGYVTFDGSNDSIGLGVTAGELGIYDADYTFEAWIYPTDISALSGDNFIFGTPTSVLRQGLHLGFRNTNIYQGHYSSDYVSGTVTANQWYHLAWTYEKNLGATNGTAKIYKNGQLQPNPGTINSFIGSAEIQIGKAFASNPPHFQGRGALFKIYNRALTSKEVLQNFDAQKVRYGTLDPEPTIVRDDLSLYYDVSNNNSYIGYGNVVYDIGSGDYPGSLVGTSYDSDGYFDFDGVDDYISSSAPLAAGQQKYTISAWWKTPVNNRIQVVWEQNSSTSQTNQRAALLLLNGNWGLNGQSNDAHNKVPVRANQWTYGVITVDTTLGSNPIKIYENGSLYWEGDTSAGASNLNVGTSGGAGLGRKISNNNEYFIGNIGLVKIYDRVLTSAEVLQNYNALKGRYIDYKATVIEDSLLLYLDAANNDSYPDTGTTWTDLSGNGCNGTLQGGVGYSADNGGVLTFDGIDDYVPLVDNFGNPQRFTIDFWCYPTALNVDSNNNYRRILTAEGVNANFILIEQSGIISFRVPGGNTDNFTASGFTGINQWGHVVCTYDQGYKRIYFNGSFVSQKEEVGSTVNFGTPQIVSPSNIQTFEGRIANFRIYDRALNAKEIEKNFNILRGRFGI